jgi:SdpC family antimicrobial peptide
MHARVRGYPSAYRAVTLALVLTVVFAGISPAARAAAGQIRPSAERPDGERLFRAIFFLEGPLSDQIPELRRLKSIDAFRKITPQAREALRAFQTRLVREMRANNPKFFESFETALQSGDRTKISRALGNASTTAKDALRKGDPGVARFLDRHEATLLREFGAVTRQLKSSGPPDLRALQRTVPKEVAQEAARTELVWLKGFKIGEPSASDPKPDTDHNIALILITFVAVVVLAFVALPLTAPDAGGDLFHERLVNSLAARAGGVDVPRR